MNLFVRLAPLLAAVFPALACIGTSTQAPDAVQDTVPAKITYAAPADPVLTTEAQPLAAKIVNAAGQPLSEHAVAVSGIPLDTVHVADEGFRCMKSGDGTLSFSGGGLSDNVTVKCRIVARVDLSVSTELELVAGTDPVPVVVTAYDEGGAVLPGVAAHVTSSVPSAVRLDPTAPVRVIPAALGVAEVAFEVGAIRSTVQVTVVERMNADPLALGDGASTTYSLERGTYKVEANATGGELRAKWVGEDCPSPPQGYSIATTCRVNNAASFVLTNPTTFGMGSSAMGNVVIYRMPEQGPPLAAPNVAAAPGLQMQPLSAAEASEFVGCSCSMSGFLGAVDASRFKGRVDGELYEVKRTTPEGEYPAAYKSTDGQLTVKMTLVKAGEPPDPNCAECENFGPDVVSLTLDLGDSQTTLQTDLACGC